MVLTVLLVALGGAIGAVLRYLSGVGLTRLLGYQDFPLATLAVNVAGSFLMGAFVIIAAQRGLIHLSPLVMTGLLGGFTTFSAFSLEAVTLFERGAPMQAVLYVAVSVGLSIAALVVGMGMARGLWV